MPPSSDRYLIVSLDGGGIRGVVSSRLLDRLEDRHPGLLTRVDLFAGTSTGGILALAFAAGHSPREMTDLYRKQGADVFAERRGRALRKIDHLVHARYPGEPLHEMLTGLFGELRLGDLKQKVVVTTFRVDPSAHDGDTGGDWRPKFFHNFEQSGSSDADELVVDVAMRTAAAPTFLPIYQGFADGGIVAVNPSMCAVAQALDPRGANRNIGDIALLSVGTGSSVGSLHVDDPDWGLVQWTPHLLPLMFQGDKGVIDFECRQLLGSRYCRIDASTPGRSRLDDVGNISLLQSAADAVDLEEAEEWALQFVQR